MASPTASAEEQAQQQAQSSFLTRVTLIFLGWSLLHGAIVGALVAGVTPGGWWTIGGAFLVLVVAPLSVLIASFRDHAYPSAFTRVFVMRPFWYVQVALFFLSVVGALVFLVGLPFRHGLAWARVALAVEAALLLLTFVVGYVGSRWIVVKRVDAKFDDLPAELEGLTIAQLSDLHVGPHTPAGHLAKTVRVVEEAKPDLIAFTGDQVDDYDRDVVRFAKTYGGLRAPLGVYAIAGNHDIYAGWPGVREGMEKVGMRVLVNQAVPAGRGPLWVAGTGDPAGLQSVPGGSVAAPDVDRTLQDVPPDAFTLVLAHNPALWPALAQRGAHLTLSGHTHHGQLSIPFLNWSIATPFLGELAMGHLKRGRSQLYINPGTNFWGLPLRIGAWPEVTLVTLRKGS